MSALSSNATPSNNRQSVLDLSFLQGADPRFIAELFQRYLEDKTSVDASWQSFFAELGADGKAMLVDATGIEWPSAKPPAASTGGSGVVLQNGNAVQQSVVDSIQALMLTRAYRIRGHLYANVDPLGLTPVAHHPDLEPETYGFGKGDMDRPVFINHQFGLESTTIRNLVDVLKRTYSGKVGVEYMHIQDPVQREWIQTRIEGVRNQTEFTVGGKKAILARLTAAEIFEQYLHKKFPGTKRFGLDGGEAMIPGVEQIIKRGGQLGLKEVVIGMAHRGRLNMLGNVLGKPFTTILAEFQGMSSKPDDVQGSGDVKYHMGTSSDRDFEGKNIHLSLTANPSHLEAVNGVVLGKVRAKQKQRGDTERTQVLPLLVHGDAAFAGQGPVAEALMLWDLKGYSVGGTIHFVINNQIGFTTSPSYSRSGPYCTDVARMVQAPIFHVNGDDAEAVVHVCRIATEFRQEFKKDVVIDMFCYRRYGHNESDEPAFTQPLMYKAIATHTSVRQIYADQLKTEKVIQEGDDEGLVKDFTDTMEFAFEKAKDYKPNKADWLEGRWTGLRTATSDDRRGKTSVPLATLKSIGDTLCKVPEGFATNPKITRQLEAKHEVIKTGAGVDWGTAEALAFGSLCLEGFPVRLSGQDVGRGTFSHRHAILYDQNTEERYSPLSHIDPAQATFEVHDSPLSEFAVLAFEHGYSLSEPNALVIWEAQFGDFANGAQVIIDQFISSSEPKWLRMSGLVLLLPHGYEGQGPEHSSARLERFLQLCAEDNMQVLYPSTPASMFHALRRQMHRDFRKPLIMMSPKSLLRHKLCVSDLNDLAEGTSFHRVLLDKWKHEPKSIKRVVLCTGKVYYDLYQAREDMGIKDVAILRLEQLYPFPSEPLAEELVKYPNAEVIWCQEEPENMGAWSFVDRKIEKVLAGVKTKSQRPMYIGRPEAASPATGSLKKHNEEQAALVKAALTR